MNYFNYEEINVNCFKGKVFTSIENKGDLLVFNTSEETFHMLHVQDCCESVELEDVCGNLLDLIGEPILIAHENSNHDNPQDGDELESFTWTFYELATIKGSVTLRWYGTSNGYYSESVDIYNVTKEKEWR